MESEIFLQNFISYGIIYFTFRLCYISCLLCETSIVLTLQWTVQVDPKFHEGASNLKELVPFEECLELHSTDEGVVRVPDYLLLTHNGRSFKLVFSILYLAAYVSCFFLAMLSL